MNVTLQYYIDFLGAVWFEDRLHMNSYSLGLSLLTASDNSSFTNVAMERVKHFINYELANAVFINQQHDAVCDSLKKLGANMCTLPDEPVDQIIGIMLFCKLNAITQGNLLITELEIASTQGDNIWYKHHADDNIGPFVQEGWWSSKNYNKTTIDTKLDKNVVSLERDGWKEYGLEWPDQQPKKAKILRPNFKKNDKQ